MNFDNVSEISDKHIINFPKMGAINYFVTNRSPHPLPEWFRDRWGQSLYLGGNLCPKFGTKYWSNLEEDIQRALRESWTNGLEPLVTLVYLHECGNVTRVDISVNSIHYSEPIEWREIPHTRAHEAWDSCAGRPWPEERRTSLPLK